MICNECETVALCSRKGECHFSTHTAQNLLDKHAKFSKYQKLVVINVDGVRKIVDIELTVRQDGERTDVVDVRLV